jgi:hypothetical protein
MAYEFPYGDFQKVHRCGILSAESRAAQIQTSGHRKRRSPPAWHDRSAQAFGSACVRQMRWAWCLRPVRHVRSVDARVHPIRRLRRHCIRAGAGSEEFLIAVNFSNQPFLGLVDVSNAPPYSEVTPAIEKPGASSPPYLSLDAWGFRIFQRTLPPEWL